MIGVKVCQVALLLSVGIAVVWAQVQCDSADEGKLKCASCASTGTCDASGSVTPKEDDPCGDNEACVEDRGTAFCAPVEYSECNTCGTELTGCDLFDDSIVIFCLEGQKPVVFKTCNEDEKCENGACVPSSSGPDLSKLCTSDESTESGESDGSAEGPKLVTNKPQCNTGVVCLNGAYAKHTTCPEGQYYSLETNRCKSLPVNHCEGKTDGLFPHLTDCKSGVVCRDGEYILDIPCKPEQYFQDDGCADTTAESAVCPPLDGCTDLPTITADSVIPETETSTTESTTTTTESTTTTTESVIVPDPITTTTESIIIPDPITTTTTTESTTTTTTLKPSTCTSFNVNKRYPHDTDCKKYYTCRKITTTTYKYVESTCPGDLVFNVAQSYCDLVENVPSCNASG